MALDNVKKSILPGNELCIWDPSPMCLNSGVTTIEAAMEKNNLNNLNNQLARDRYNVANTLHSENKFYSVEEHESCNSWDNASQRARDGDFDPTRKLDPRYKENTRFIIIAAGPTGSGKTEVANAIKKEVVTTLNPTVANLRFVNLGHDVNIKNDPRFINQYNNIISWGIKSNDITKDKINEVFNLYETFKTNKNGMTRKQKEDKAIELANTYIKYSESLTEIPSKSELEEKEPIASKSELEEKEPIASKSEPKESIAYDTYLYFQVCIAFYLGLNINYETTLKNPESIKFLTKAAGIFTEGCVKFDYVFILGFPIVELSQLEQRIKDRFDNRKGQIEFLDMLPDKEGSISVDADEKAAVAVTATTDNKLLDNMKQSYILIAGIIENCTGTAGMRTICGENGKIGIDYLALFDNTKKCIYNESKTETTVEQCKVNTMPKLDVLPISERSYVLLKGGQYKNPVTRLQLQIPQKRTLIALLMTNLNRAIKYDESKNTGVQNDELECSPDCESPSFLCLSPTTIRKSCVKSMNFDDRPVDLKKFRAAYKTQLLEKLYASAKFSKGGKRKTPRHKKKRKRRTRRKRKLIN